LSLLLSFNKMSMLCKSKVFAVDLVRNCVTSFTGVSSVCLRYMNCYFFSLLWICLHMIAFTIVYKFLFINFCLVSFVGVARRKVLFFTLNCSENPLFSKTVMYDRVCECMVLLAGRELCACAVCALLTCYLVWKYLSAL
jgi:hypothetical protein